MAISPAALLRKAKQRGTQNSAYDLLNEAQTYGSDSDVSLWPN